MPAGARVIYSESYFEDLHYEMSRGESMTRIYGLDSPLFSYTLRSPAHPSAATSLANDSRALFAKLGSSVYSGLGVRADTRTS